MINHLKRENKMLKIKLINSKDIFENNNNGYEFGLYILNENNKILDCEWYKSEKEREEEIKRRKL